MCVLCRAKMLALKIVRVDERGEQSQALIDSYSNEIALLKRLQGNRFIINLENAEVRGPALSGRRYWCSVRCF